MSQHNMTVEFSKPLFVIRRKVGCFYDRSRMINTFSFCTIMSKPNNNFLCRGVMTS